MTDFALARRNMVDGQLRPNRVNNAQLLAVVGALPRERFLPDGMKSVAYSDEDVPLGNGRFLMEPMVLARLIQTLQAGPGDKALVVYTFNFTDGSKQDSEGFLIKEYGSWKIVLK